MRIEPGAVVDERYEVIQELTQGATTTLYTARDRKFDARIALKVAVAAGEAYHEFLARFQREARIGYLLGQRRGYVRALDWGQLPDRMTVYLALDLLEGSRPLDLTQGTLDERLRALESLTERVAGAHALGIVHRDLRPQNALVTPDGVLHLADFGQAKISAQGEEDDESFVHVTKPGSLVGTPAYMAPEQFSDPSNVDAQADVYSLGVMLFTCLTGRLPYEGKSAVEIMSQHVQVRYGAQPPPRPRDLDPGVPPELDALCASALEPERERRLNTAAELGAALRAWRRDHAHAPDHGPARRRLGLDDQGFVPATRLRASLEELGEPAFLSWIGDAPALLVEDERPVEGVRQYEGRVAFLLQRETGEPGERITLGRAAETDVVVDLVTISKQHVSFQRRGREWVVVDAGSHNGSSLGGVALSPDDPRPLRDHSVIRLAQHLSVRFLHPAALAATLRG